MMTKPLKAKKRSTTDRFFYNYLSENYLKKLTISFNCSESSKLVF